LTGPDLQRREIDEPIAVEHLENPAPFQIGQLVDRLARRLRRGRGRRGVLEPPGCR
jgi:hypothetical protein